MAARRAGNRWATAILVVGGLMFLSVLPAFANFTMFTPPRGPAGTHVVINGKHWPLECGTVQFWFDRDPSRVVAVTPVLPDATIHANGQIPLDATVGVHPISLVCGKKPLRDLPFEVTDGGGGGTTTTHVTAPSTTSPATTTPTTEPTTTPTTEPATTAPPTTAPPTTRAGVGTTTPVQTTAARPATTRRATTTTVTKGVPEGQGQVDDATTTTPTTAATATTGAGTATTKPGTEVLGEQEGPGTLTLDHAVTPPGGSVSASGSGCDPSSPVVIEIDGNQVGTALAAADGTFTAPLDIGGLAPGRFDVVAHCGTDLHTPLDVVLLASTGGAGASVFIVLFVVLIGGAVLKRQRQWR